MSKRKLLLYGLAVLAVAEIVLRSIWGLGSPVLLTVDSSCGYILKPNQDVHRFGVHTHINRFGMRSDDFSAIKDPGTMRVLFLGDSITYGTTQVDQDSTFAGIVKRELGKRLHRRVEVLNASAGGWAMDNEVGFVRSRSTFGSDLVLLVLNSGDLRQARSDVDHLDSSMAIDKPSSAISEIYHRFIVPKLQHLSVRVDAGTSVADGSDENVVRNLALLSELRSLTEKQGGRLGIIYVPFRRDIDDFSLSSMPSPLVQWAKMNRVNCVDLTSEESMLPIEDITLRDHVHFNALGNRIIAAGIEKSWSF